jgi:hypothetical protein
MCGRVGWNLISSVSVTANAKVTNWRNEYYSGRVYAAFRFKNDAQRMQWEEGETLGKLRWIPAEIAYGLIAAVGVLEVIARLVCAVVLVPFGLIAAVVGVCCLPEKGPAAKIAQTVAYLTIGTSLGGALASAGTVLDALSSLKNNLSWSSPNLDWTRWADKCGLFDDG